ncbi:hypothetical protein RAJCM14343_1582 [Rhodococcus aetherivorans]|uniref:Uncharacterized protein n=1 Tax=Rhodococcus aetherivorans TaxID=191292 RepID=A0ABQ0YIM4_9NOCA|nr:hypothetical protein RAJCM14343_1582 [Rhodococcus aetherivorans]CCW15585.1 hypothetical protein EBESD8_61620 [Rhodococcus aetherivorans]
MGQAIGRQGVSSGSDGRRVRRHEVPKKSSGGPAPAQNRRVRDRAVSAATAGGRG